MSKVVFNPTAPSVVGCKVDDYSLGAAAVNKVVGNPSTTQVAVRDRVVARTTGASDFVQTISIAPSAPRDDTVSVINSTPGVCSVSADGSVDIVGAGGECVLNLRSAKGSAYFERRYVSTVALRSAPVVETPLPLSGAPGSLRRHLWEQMLAAVNGKTPSTTTQDIYTGVTVGAAPTATVNPNLFIPGLDFSHCAFQKRSAAIPSIESKSVCHLISPRHVLGSMHVGANTYKELWFRKPDGSFQYVQATNVENWNGDWENPVGFERLSADTVVLYLSEPVTGITPVRFVPANYRQKLPDFHIGTSDIDLVTFNPKPKYPLPALALFWRDGQGESSTPLYSDSRHLRVNLISHLLSSGQEENFQSHQWPLQPEFAPVNSWTARAQGGDSGSLWYFYINGQAAAFGLESGKVLPDYLSLMTTKMNKLAVDNGEVNPNYAPQTIDLSMFPSY
jgi:hypothetical protein